MNLRQLALVIAGVLMTTASAQEACPGGTQVGQDCRGGYCVPICAYNDSPQSTQGPPPRVVERWEVFDDRFGALAIDTRTGGFSTSAGETSREAAEQSVMRRCREEKLACESLSYVKNGCLSLAWGGGKTRIEVGRDERISEATALRACKVQSGVECEIIKTTCSFPVSRWVYEKPPGWQPAEQ